LKHVIVTDNGGNVTQIVQGRLVRILVQIPKLLFFVSYRRANDEDLQRNDDKKCRQRCCVYQQCRCGIRFHLWSTRVFRFSTQTVLDPLGAPAPSAADVGSDPAANITVQSTRNTESSSKGAALTDQVLTDTAVGAKRLQGSPANSTFASDTMNGTKAAGAREHDAGIKCHKGAGANVAEAAANDTMGAGVSVKAGVAA